MQESVISGAIHIGKPTGLVREFRDRKTQASERIEAAGLRHQVKQLSQKLEDADFEIAALKRKLRAQCVRLEYEEPKPDRTIPVKIKVDNHIEPGAIKKGPVCLRLILDCVAAYYGKTPEDLKSDRRTWGEVEPRHVVFYFCKRLTELSFASMGRAMGNRDHSTIVHAISKMEFKRSNNADFAERLDRIAILIKQNVDVNAQHGCPHD